MEPWAKEQSKPLSPARSAASGGLALRLRPPFQASPRRRAGPAPSTGGPTDRAARSCAESGRAVSVDLVAVMLQQLYERAQDQHMRCVGEVDPDPHRSRIVVAARPPLRGGRWRDRSDIVARLSAPRRTLPGGAAIHLSGAQKRPQLPGRRLTDSLDRPSAHPGRRGDGRHAADRRDPHLRGGWVRGRVGHRPRGAARPGRAVRRVSSSGLRLSTLAIDGSSRSLGAAGTSDYGPALRGPGAAGGGLAGLPARRAADDRLRGRGGRLARPARHPGARRPPREDGVAGRQAPERDGRARGDDPRAGLAGRAGDPPGRQAGRA